MPANFIDPNLLLVRYRPRPDELLTSWLVRLAWFNGHYLQRFWQKRLGGREFLWSTDLDRGFLPVLAQALAEKTGTDVQRAAETTLRAYEGFLFETMHGRGSMSMWILPVTPRGQVWTEHGQQFCPRCLAEDPMPYFRRRWRLALSVLCTRHRIGLRDACPGCDGPVAYYGLRFYDRPFPKESPLTFCPACGADYRINSLPTGPPLSDELVAFQQALYDVLDHNAPLLGAAHPPFPHLFFAGYHRLLHVLSSNGEASRLRKHLEASGDRRPLEPRFRSRKERFEELRQEDRCRVMELSMPLLRDWPDQFIETCRNAKMALIHLVEFHYQYPFWYDHIVRYHFNQKRYRATLEERGAAGHYLARIGKKASQNQINRILGLHHFPKSS